MQWPVVFGAVEYAHFGFQVNSRRNPVCRGRPGWSTRTTAPRIHRAQALIVL